MKVSQQAITATLILTFFIGACGKTKSPKFEKAWKTPEIHAISAFEHAKQICAIGPRPSGSEGAKKNISYIRSVLDKLEVPYEIDEWTENTVAGKLSFANLLAKIEGTKKDFILVGAHYDTKALETVPNFEGANDGASGIAALLAMIEAIKKSSFFPKYTLVFAFFDGEECRFLYSDSDGLHGSRRLSAKFAKDKSQNCLAVIILDMIGDKGLQIELPSDSDPKLAKILFEAARAKGLEKYFIWGKNPILDDHVPFQRIGIPAIDLIDFNFGPSNLYWHSPEDKLENVSPESIQIVANTTLAMLVMMQSDKIFNAKD